MTTSKTGDAALGPATWHQVKLILGRALEYTPAAQRDYVARACGGNEFLQAQVEALLDEAGIDADRFLESPPLLPARREPSQESTWIGRRIGPFRIADHIATGGMGHVFLAQRADGLFRQAVAIKLLRQDIDSPATRRRMEHERHIHARLNHPFITQFMDGGDIDGRPYMVLAHVEGEPIDAYCRNHRLDVRARIGLVLDVCAAVAHAHAQGVVHRDIKPRNLLVTADGKPRLLDFGIAEALQAGDVPPVPGSLAMFTPECAAPEQLRSRPLTLATDVYGLGVLLYLLLTGHLPHAERRNAQSLLDLHAICEEDPVPASEQVRRAGVDACEGLPATRRLARMLEGPLDAILSKALAREPGDRYDSVAAFGADLGRYLGGCPVAAFERPSIFSLLVHRIRPRRWRPA